MCFNSWCKWEERYHIRNVSKDIRELRHQGNQITYFLLLPKEAALVRNGLNFHLWLRQTARVNARHTNNMFQSQPHCFPPVDIWVTQDKSWRQHHIMKKNTNNQCQLQQSMKGNYYCPFLARRGLQTFHVDAINVDLHGTSWPTPCLEGLLSHQNGWSHLGRSVMAPFGPMPAF